MSDKDEVKRWYAEHGIEYLDRDWGPRSEIGESAGVQGMSTKDGLNTRDPSSKRHDQERYRNEQQLLRLEEQGRLRFPWLDRQDNEQLAALEDFLTPYIASLPRAQARVLDVWMFGRSSHREVAEALGMTHQNVTSRLRAAGRRLVREIAAGERFMMEVVDGDPHEELDDGELAWRVFNNYWRTRFGREYG
jgi:hypothetical protein